MKKISQELWIEKVGDQYTIGLTPVLQDDIGYISYVNIAKGPNIDRDDTLFNVEASKATIEVASPLSGKIVKINEAALDQPSLLNSPDSTDHWVAVLTDVDETEFDLL